MGKEVNGGRGWLVLVALGLGGIVGCQPSEPDPPARPAVRAPRKEDPAAKAARPKAEPPAKPTIPKVVLSNELLATCRVKVGDAMPEADLVDLDGKTQTLSKLFGKKLSVVFFWQAESEYSRAELEDLAADVAGPYADRGVTVVGINYKDATEVAKKAAADANAKYPILLDPKGEYFARVATEKIHRTYLLDAAGKILWFDLEYSRTTERQLLEAIDVALAQ